MRMMQICKPQLYNIVLSAKKLLFSCKTQPEFNFSHLAAFWVLNFVEKNSTIAAKRESGLWRETLMVLPGGVNSGCQHSKILTIATVFPLVVLMQMRGMSVRLILMGML
jgi:hypothetical protein